MQSSFLRRTLPRSIIALAVVALGLFLSRGDTSAFPGPSFTASTSTTIAGSATNGVTNATADETRVFAIPINDYNYAYALFGTPKDVSMAPGPGNPGFVAGTSPALGEVMGTLASSSTLGLTGNPCTNAVGPGFTFLNATTTTTDEIDAVPQDKTNPGSGGTLDNMWSDDGSSTTGPDAQAPWHLAWPGMDAGESINGLPAQVDEYPSYLNVIFDPDYAGGDPFTGAQPVQPLQRLAGATNVVGTSVTLNLVIFAPGALSSAFAPPHPFATISDLGYTTVAVLNDTTVAGAHGSISDFCTPLITTTVTYGMSKANPCSGGGGGAACDTAPEISAPAPGADSKVRSRNPAADGYYTWRNKHMSQRDADGDGNENGLDACPVNTDTYNPRTGLPAAQDSDGDGLPNVCDPDPSTFNNDQDGDAWENSYDNCALVSNIDQADGEVNIAYGTTAPDGGPRGDSIGNACDADNTISNGSFIRTVSTTTLCINSTGTNAGPMPCNGSRDEDDAAIKNGDGYTKDLEDGTPLCGNAANDDGTGPMSDDAVVNDGCGAIPQAGAYSEAQFNITTSSIDRCGLGDTTGGPPSKAWPSNLATGAIPNSVNRVQVLDLTSFLAPVTPVNLRRLGTWPGSPVADGQFSSRWDLQPGRGVFGQWINATDITTMTGANAAVPQNFPPMLGVRAWNNPADCTD